SGRLTVESLEGRLMLSGAAPTTVDDSYTFPSATQTGDSVYIPPRGVLGNDFDTDNDPLTATLDSLPAHGKLTLNPDGSFLYTADVGFHGVDTFTYHANDGLADGNIATVSILVDAPPVAVADLYLVAPGAMLTVGAATGVLANDHDDEGNSLVAEQVTS